MIDPHRFELIERAAACSSLADGKQISNPTEYLRDFLESNPINISLLRITKCRQNKGKSILDFHFPLLLSA